MIRNLIIGEELPERLQTGFENTSTPEWIFVCERDGKPVGILIMAPAHIVVILLRLAMMPEAHPNDVRELLHHAIAEMKARGYKGYMTWVDPTRDVERALIGIVRGSGGVQLPNMQVACAGAF